MAGAVRVYRRPFGAVRSLTHLVRALAGHWARGVHATLLVRRPAQ